MTVIVILCLLSLHLSFALYERNKKLYPIYVSIKDGLLEVKTSDEVLALYWYGYQKFYPLKECVWYIGSIDQYWLPSLGILCAPFYIRKGIIIYHLITGKKIEVGFSNQSRQQWEEVLHKMNVPQCRSRIFCEPIIVLLFFVLGIYLAFYLAEILDKWTLGLLIHIPLIGAAIGSFLSGNDLFYYQWKMVLGFCLWLFFLFLICICFV
ncbi:MAG: hypothetical protein LBC02_09400 [Planctomycetaceae bacterium]|nr:hypothetical protein [Planctomycetaceae bacterium]